jgi:hypothetical protein
MTCVLDLIEFGINYNYNYMSWGEVVRQNTNPRELKSEVKRCKPHPD